VRIGVVSDTHNNLANVRRIVELFAQARVERVVHTGDITQVKTLRVLAELGAPLFGVFGNNDQGERESLEQAAAELGMELADSPLELVWAGRRILVVHDPRELEAHLDGHDLVLHGHTHERRIERSAGRLVFNPGECAGHLEGRNAVGVVDLATLDVEILHF
jgi:putative phosphoesterase